MYLTIACETISDILPYYDGQTLIQKDKNTVYFTVDDVRSSFLRRCCLTIAL